MLHCGETQTAAAMVQGARLVTVLEAGLALIPAMVTVQEKDYGNCRIMAASAQISKGGLHGQEMCP